MAAISQCSENGAGLVVVYRERLERGELLYVGADVGIDVWPST